MTNTERNTVERIRASYEAKEVSKLDQLKAIDRKVKRPATIFAYVYGSLSTLVLGTGMCLAMEIIGSFMALGIGVGVVGMALMASTYPIYKAILKSRKNKYGSRVIELSDSILNQ